MTAILTSPLDGSVRVTGPLRKVFPPRSGPHAF